MAASAVSVTPSETKECRRDSPGKVRVSLAEGHIPQTVFAWEPALALLTHAAFLAPTASGWMETPRFPRPDGCGPGDGVGRKSVLSPGVAVWSVVGERLFGGARDREVSGPRLGVEGVLL